MNHSRPLFTGCSIAYNTSAISYFSRTIISVLTVLNNLPYTEIPTSPSLQPKPWPPCPQAQQSITSTASSSPKLQAYTTKLSPWYPKKTKTKAPAGSTTSQEPLGWEWTTSRNLRTGLTRSRNTKMLLFCSGCRGRSLRDLRILQGIVRRRMIRGRWRRWNRTRRWGIVRIGLMRFWLQRGIWIDDCEH